MPAGMRRYRPESRHPATASGATARTVRRDVYCERLGCKLIVRAARATTDTCQAAWWRYSLTEIHRRQAWAFKAWTKALIFLGVISRFTPHETICGREKLMLAKKIERLTPQA